MFLSVASVIVENDPLVDAEVVMTGDELREHLREILDVETISTMVQKYGIQERERKFDVFGLVLALILAGGTHEGGRQYDVLRAARSDHAYRWPAKVDLR
jgi:hypothetical protein